MFGFLRGSTPSLFKPKSNFNSNLINQKFPSNQLYLKHVPEKKSFSFNPQIVKFNSMLNSTPKIFYSTPNYTQHIQTHKLLLTSVINKYYSTNAQREFVDPDEVVDRFKVLLAKGDYQTVILEYAKAPMEVQNDFQVKDLYAKATVGYASQTASTDPSVSIKFPSRGVPVEFKSPPHAKFANFLKYFVYLAFLVLMFLLMNNSQQGVKDISKLLSKEVSKKSGMVDVKFDDVLGMDEVIEEVKTLVDYLKNPDKYAQMGARMTKGILLSGSPGTGKTLLARAIAGEAGVPFFYANGSEFEELFVGLGSKRIRDLFEKAKSEMPCIIFIDEIDSLGISRELQSVGHVRDDTLNQLLAELDGFEQNTGVIFIGATNLPENLDKALTRPGRFDKHITVPHPDVNGRQKILEHYLDKVKCTESIDTKALSMTTVGMTGADLFNIINVAAIKAGKLGLKGINTQLIEQAYDDVVMGLERKHRTQSVDSVKKTAFYKTGNAIVSYYSKGSDGIRKVTIISRGKSDGKIAYASDKDQTSMSRVQLLSNIKRIFGGRIGEELYTGPENVTTGSVDDYSMAYKIAHKMVTEWGLSDKLGTVCLSVDEENWGFEIRKMVDEEVKRILSECFDEAKEIIYSHRKEFDQLCDALQKYETLSGEQVKEIIDGNLTEIKG